jgi:transaldolase
VSGGITEMRGSYFQRLYKQTPTRMWVNNPSGEECDKAIAAGAINCTTNPQYCQKLLSSDPEYIQGVIDDILLNETVDHEEVAQRVYQVVSKRILDKFRPLYEESKGEYGYVTMQDDPRRDEDTGAVMVAVQNNQKLGSNFMVKIPVIDGGMQAIEQCVEENIPICATEVFSLAQTIDICELYEKAAKRSGNHPFFYVTHITGIFDEYLQKYARRAKINIDDKVLAQAGCTVARKEYRLIKERGYKTIVLGGGVRALYHFTEMVGGDIHVTMNWKDIDTLLKEDGAVESRIETETPKDVVDEIYNKFEVFRQAYLVDGLKREEYADFGPVQLFRNSFIMGWFTLLAEISKRRTALAL